MNEKPPRYNGVNGPLCIKTRGTYKPEETTFLCSRSSLEKFSNCPTCFYMEQKIGLKPPPSAGWAINSAVDELVKDEMDRHRMNGTTPEILKDTGLQLFCHENLNNWRETSKGIRYKDEQMNIDFYGAIDDVLVNEHGELVMMDTKSTSKKDDILTSENVWNNGLSYKRQLEIYSWLFQKNGFPVSSTGYLLYYNGIKKSNEFNGIMKFKTTLVPFELDTIWVDFCIMDMIECLQQESIPQWNDKCDQCLYWKLYQSFREENTTLLEIKV